MSDQNPAMDAALQFDHVGDGTTAPAAVAVTCSSCHNAIDTEYFDINGHPVCDRCRGVLEAAAETPRGLGPFLTATLFGFIAAVAGAVVYYGVIAIANLEIGIIAILCGYMVGYSVRTGAGGRGGRRFQYLAIALTYLSIALAYTPVFVKGAIEANRENKPAVAAAGNATPATPAPEAGGSPPQSRGFVSAVVVLAALCLALPILAIVGSLPMGLISAAIMFFGMRQAWKMTGAPHFTVLGPYRVGASVSASA